ncbi:MAG: 30S ribosomal protein S17e [Candidatus Thorarchaeota archaeon]
MGSVRPGFIKNAARSLMQLYPDAFTDDFESNKRLVEQLTDIETKKVRNRVAGYLVRLVRIQLAREESEAEEAAAEEPITDTEM